MVVVIKVSTMETFFFLPGLHSLEFDMDDCCSEDEDRNLVRTNSKGKIVAMARSVFHEFSIVQCHQFKKHY
jgi:hypothetical protein